ncbi:phage major capsid protein [bacterium]|nr:phage major capsid protein [bacterium]
MPLTLAEAAKLETDGLRKGVIETFGEFSPILDDLPFIEVMGNSFKYNQEASLPDVEFRDVNAAYTESAGTFTQETESLVIFGGVVDVDRYIQKTRGSINDQRAIQTRMKVKSLALAFTRTFFEGDSAIDTSSFDGLAKRLSGTSQEITADDGGGNGGTLSLDLIDELIDAVWGGPDVLYMNRHNRRKLTTLARNSSIIEVYLDDFGKQVTRYDGIPVRLIGKDENNDEILGNDETVGTDTTTSSIYAVKYGADEFVCGITNGGIQVEDLGLIPSPPAYRTLIEFYVGLALFHPEAAARLKGVKQ